MVIIQAVTLGLSTLRHYSKAFPATKQPTLRCLQQLHSESPKPASIQDVLQRKNRIKCMNKLRPIQTMGYDSTIGRNEAPQCGSRL